MRIKGIGVVKKEDAMSILTKEGKEAVRHLYGDFLEWYIETYPNAKKLSKGRKSKEL